VPEIPYCPQMPRVESEHHRTSASSDLTLSDPVTTCFQQPCPACGRRLLIRVEHLGQQVSCSHCRCAFVARDISQDRGYETEQRSCSLERAERLLAALDSSNERYRVCNV
jgi:hypothetical protein